MSAHTHRAMGPQKRFSKRVFQARSARPDRGSTQSLWASGAQETSKEDTLDLGREKKLIKIFVLGK